jgi:hypothetical protein
MTTEIDLSQSFAYRASRDNCIVPRIYGVGIVPETSFENVLSAPLESTEVTT